MTDLRAFIEARLAEDERAASIDGPSPRPWVAVTDADGGPCVRTGTDEEPEWQREVNHQVWHCDDEADGCPEQARMWIAEAEHIVRHDPARVLREVAYKRRIFARHAPVVDGTQSSWAWFQGSESASEEALRELAMVWSDHPDYRTEWSTA